MTQDAPQAPTLPPLSPVLRQAVERAMETLVKMAPRSPRALQAVQDPDGYTEMYARAILGAPLDAIPIAVVRITQTEEHFPSVARFRSAVLEVARQHFAPPAPVVPRRERSRPAAPCCGSEYHFRRFRVTREDGREHTYERSLCDCQAEAREARGEELLEVTL